MSVGVTYKISLLDDASKALGGIGAHMDRVGGGVHQLNDRLRALGGKLFVLNNIKEALSNFSSSMESAIAPGIALDTSLKDLSAIGGVTGKELDQISHAARKTAQQFGIAASGAVESYKLILSQLGPEIANNSTAMDAMGKHIATLSKTMGGDATAAATVLTTAMNQYSIDTTDASKAAQKMGEMMNVMAAAANEGSAELPQINEALKQSGMVAASAGVSFEELNATIQVLDKAGKKGAEGGVAVRNVIQELGKGRFQVDEVQRSLASYGISVTDLEDKNKTLAEKLRLLQPLQKDGALLTKMFGTANAAAALAMIQGVDTIQTYTQKITGTNTAVEQADIIMSSYAEKTARANAWMNDFKISLFHATQSFMPYLSAVGKGIGEMGTFSTGLVSMISIVRMLPFGQLAGGFTRATTAFIGYTRTLLSGFGQINLATAVTSGTTTAWGLITQKVVRGMILPALRSVGIAMMNIPILGWIAAAVSGLAWLGAYLWDTSKQFREITMGIWEVISFVGGKVWNVFATWFTTIWQGIRKVYDGVVSVLTTILNVGSKVFNGLVDIVRKAVAWIGDKLGFVFQPIAALVDKIFGGTSIAQAYQIGKQKGADSYDRDHADKDSAAKPPSILDSKKTDKHIATPLLAHQQTPLLHTAPSSKSTHTGGIKNINIQMTNLVGAIHITHQHMQDTATEMKRKVQAALIEAVNDVQFSI